MNAEIEARLPQIKALCEKYGVIRLELFGSVTGPEFDPKTSDCDFIARFAETGLGTNYAGRYFDFIEGLERLLERPVDLIVDKEFRNPYFAREVNESRMTIYESTRVEASA